ncbi:hypothetical protein [Marinomonas algicola]|uniref:hypothetical protein n=1 Tax=Marinomonas algicola TaxID=2773454 RepID=UPI00174CDD04|nr:hypothetical protein [Marinomonas algicola]
MLRYFLLVIFIAVNDSYGFEFLNSDVYLEERPRQASLMKQFEGVVNRPAEPLLFPQVNTINISAILPKNTRRSSFLSAFKQRMKRLQIDYRLDVVEYSLDVENDTLFEAYQKVMQYPPDYLITTLERIQQKAIIESILRKNDTKIMLYDVSSPVKGWENESAVFYAGVNYLALADSFANLLGHIHRPDSDIVTIAFDSGYRNQQYCNEFLDSFTASGYTAEKIVYFDGSDSLRRTLLRALKSENRNVLVFQCDNFLSIEHLDLFGLSQDKVTIINRWQYEGDLSQKDASLVRFKVPFDKVEVALAEMIKHHLESKRYPTLYLSNLTFEGYLFDPLLM